MGLMTGRTLQQLMKDIRNIADGIAGLQENIEVIEATPATDAIPQGLRGIIREQLSAMQDLLTKALELHNQTGVGIRPDLHMSIDHIMDRLSRRGHNPPASFWDYDAKLDWLHRIGYTWDVNDRRFIFRFRDGTPNLLGSDDPSNKWSFEDPTEAD